MFRDFYFPAFYPPYPRTIPINNIFPFSFPYFHDDKFTALPYRIESQSYTTKQVAVKQQPAQVKKQEEPVQQHNEAEIKIEGRRKKQNKSIFHNYQKHLVTTLKQKITIQQIRDFDPEDLCLKQMWHGFTRAKIANRTLLLAVFGQEKPNNNQVIKYLQKCKLEGIVKKFSIVEIKQAQKKIRKIVKQYFKDKNLDIELAGRKLPKEEKTIFKHYVSYFLAQLADGTLNRRLPKRYKQQMMT